MYIPKKFDNQDLEKSIALIERYPLATLISQTESGPFVSHLPLVLEKIGADLFLYGHLARANPHWKWLGQKPVYCIFHGPNRYITPKWYVEHDVPTWNYAVVHADGNCALLEKREEILLCLKKLTDHAERNTKDPWEFWVPDDLAQSGTLERAITGFKISVTSLKAKFKLSQNRSEEDRENLKKSLNGESDEAARAILAMIKDL